MAIKTCELFQSSSFVADLLTKLNVGLLLDLHQRRMLYFSAWQRELPYPCTKIVFFDQKDNIRRANWKDEHALWPLHHIPNHLFSIWHAYMILIDHKS